jgi:4-alpha-glucanotransferase
MNPGPPVPEPVLARRRAGILLHPTSLPGPGNDGVLGRHAYYFVDFLQSTGQSVWQVLPLGPTHVDRSPYFCLSAHAGNPALISLDLASQWGWLPPPYRSGSSGASHAQLLDEIGSGFVARATDADGRRFEEFVARHADWLEDYVLYQAIRDQRGQAWIDWPPPLRDRDPAALADERRGLAPNLHRLRVIQFVFFRQWLALRGYANGRGVRLFGDLPIYVAHDSADVWAHRDNFKLDGDGLPMVVAGVPPDQFSATGQHWGNPLYDWGRMAADGFHWWEERMRTQVELYDLMRIDHFRGFDACWEIPRDAAAPSAGTWVRVPGEQFFDHLTVKLGALPVVAEDLGHITEAVHQLRRRYGYPGMKVLQFAFDGGPENQYLPHHHALDDVVYTGTHDNDTTRGWFESLGPGGQARVREYAGHADEPMPWPLVRMALGSVCRLCILPMQDVLGLGTGARMNTPGTLAGNWDWRFDWPQVTPEIAGRLRQLTRLYARA